MESEDEDVIFENSVLHQALAEIGVTNLKTEPRLQMEDNAEIRADGYDETIRLPIGTEGKRSCRFNSDFVSSIFYSPKTLQEVHHYYRYHTLKWLVSSNLLSEDDQMFLQSYVDEEAPTRDPSKCLSSYTSNFFCLLLVSLILVNVVCRGKMFSSWIVADSLPEVFTGLTLYSGPINTLCLNLTWLLCVAMPILMMRRRICQKVLSKMEKQNTCIQHLVTEAVELLRLEKKCLRLVKESELVARGFTLASQHHVAHRGSDGRSSMSSNQLCHGLRQVMFSENIRVMQEVKKRVIKMMRGIPMICVDSDFSTLEMYECSPKTEVDTSSNTVGRSVDNALNGQYIDSIADEEEEMDALNRITIISPSKLTRSAELLSVYFSGFIRRLALCFFPQNLRDKTINPYEATRECTEMSREAIKRARTLIMQSYTFYRAVHQYDGKGVAKKMQGLKNIGQSQIYNLYVCVNSLDLHLQSLLHITRDLTLSLENRIDKEDHRMVSVDNEDGAETNTINKEDRELWEDILKRVKYSLDSCRGCYEESLKHLHQRTEKDTRTSSVLKETSLDMIQPKQTKVTWIPAEDPVIVDQVFEAVSDTIEEEEFQEPRPRYNAEDKAKHQEEKEAIKRFQQELQTVVSHRAIDQKAREERALARARGEATENHETPQALSKVSLPEANAAILMHHMDTPDMSEKMELETILATGHLPGVTHDTEADQEITHLPEAAEVKPSIIHIIKSTGLEKKPFSSVQIEDQKYKVTPYAAAKSQTSLDSEGFLIGKCSCEHCYHIRLEENSVSDQMSSFPVGGHELCFHKCPTHNTSFDHLALHKNSCDNSELHKNSCDNAELHKNSCDNSELHKSRLDNSEFHNSCARCKNFTQSSEEVTLLDTAKPCNKGFDTSEPHNKSCAGHKNIFDIVDSTLESDGYLNISCRKEENGNNLDLESKQEESEENIIDTLVAFKDSQSESSLVQQNSTDRLSNCSESSEDGVQPEQGSSMSPAVHMSQEHLKTTNVRRSEQKDVDIKKFQVENIFTTPSFASSNFTKNIAMMAASQARTLPNSYLAEEQFGDYISDSENSDSDI